MTRPHSSEAATLLRMSTTLGVTEPQRVALVREAQLELDTHGDEETRDAEHRQMVWRVMAERGWW